MDIAVTGSTGLIGTRLVRALEGDGHRVLRMVRPDSAGAGPRHRRMGPVAAAPSTTARSRASTPWCTWPGVGIADSRWTDEQKGRIMASRTSGTTLLADTLAGLSSPPAVLLSGSAIGYYGDHGDDTIDEATGAG